LRNDPRDRGGSGLAHGLLKPSGELEQRTQRKENVVKSNLKALVVAAAMAAAAGCAHGTATPDRGRDLRGMARVGQDARALLVGPARLVHATGEKPVRWFVADRITGDDRDCAVATPAAALPESSGAQLRVSSGKVLCAAVSSGATDVNWHKLPESPDGLWALR
jgi:hypothetical protein